MSKTTTQITALRTITNELAASVTATGFARIELDRLEQSVAWLERLNADPRGFDVAHVILGGHKPAQVRRQHVAAVREAIRFDARRAA